MTNYKGRIVMGRIIPKSIDNALKNISDKPTKEIGKTFSDIWFNGDNNTIDIHIEK